MNPIAFEIGPFAIRWYGLLIATAFLIGIIGINHEAKKKRMDVDAVFSALLITIPLAILGARIYYVIFEWSYYSLHLNEIIAVWKGGLAIHGGLLMGILSLYLCSKYYNLDAKSVFDLASPFMILGQGIGRWGNYFNQEAYGYVVDKEAWPLAMYIDGNYRHPTFLYEFIWDILGFFILLIYRKKPLPSGQVAYLYLMYYSLGRFFIESFRTDSLMFFGLRTAQCISLILFVVGLSLWLYNKRNKVN